MDFKERFYPESKFGGFTDIDGTIVFYLRVNSLINTSSTVLDFGCGMGAYGEDAVQLRRELRQFRGKAGKVIGVDLDRAAAGNPFVDEFRFLEDQGRWPLEDDSVNLCVCDSVLEHLENPGLFFSEAGRVLKDGGYLCIRTPNALGYVALLSKLIPEGRHEKVLARAQPQRKEQDIFPAFYRANTRRKLMRSLIENGFDSVVYEYEAEPSYLSFSSFVYRLGVLYQRLSPKSVRSTLFSFARVSK